MAAVVVSSSVDASVSTWMNKVMHVLLPSTIQLQLFIKDASFLEHVACLVQFQCRARALDRVMCLPLDDVLSEDEPRKEAE